ncbi:30S ribosomal protein S6--L-glutamate ligase [Candidatus Peregrinibacteria bacterium CG22_combo_CG10-13_8_21_14_all_44_10]|nr:MAG: hypothetical protein AUK45_03260 [Candidatus Peregrinibacteria bacterium CG2_30_44_17]PIP66030.1 MAG: 30S ribosomal protein S6--L-glutamate ligase [Candidatus Peregrinibacteria bacterium CG22_combo_CG10-13_8_21_14_all_44_10]PIS03522.1 MAG: 30S ribosomal protein S6--L-glutamate ligase [Candidatus Peregrinibacteria bacterium CG10_big_fil_rev_8_21_14_0_10_44_7]PIX80253.1 MAG: 30S ribosomal protein S6--L-glutamate ligase [Candidatus Peregrinibacteria bacterium CG_4_10_14_3_um_filter_44_21]P
MRIGILAFHSDKRTPYAELRLVKAARSLGYTANVLNAADCELYYDGTGSKIFYRGKPLPPLDVLIPRVGVTINVDLQASIVKHFELMGVPVLNTYDSIVKAKNKLKTLQIMSHYHMPIPKTVAIKNKDALKGAIRKVGGVPVIMKSPFGSLGSGVMIAESYRAALSILDMLWNSALNRATHMILVQEYVKESKGKDTRVLVVGGKVIACMERTAKKGEFRSNASIGGKGKAVTVSKEYEDMAIKSAELLGLEMAGVDIILTSQGPAILEVNCNPGFSYLEPVTGIDVAKAIVERAVALPVA